MPLDTGHGLRVRSSLRWYGVPIRTSLKGFLYMLNVFNYAVKFHLLGELRRV